MTTSAESKNGNEAAQRASMEVRLAEVEAENGVLRLQLDMLTSTDVVTGLPNGNGIVTQLQKAAARYARSGEAFGAMFVAFPAFTRIAEARGRRDLDDTMRHAGSLVGACVRQLDTVGRVDENGLVCVLPMMGAGDVSPVIDRIEKVLDSTPMLFDDGEEIYLVPAFAVVVCNTTARVDPLTMMNRLMEASTEAVPGTPVIRYTSTS